MNFIYTVSKPEFPFSRKNPWAGPVFEGGGTTLPQADDLYVSHLCAIREPSPNVVHLSLSNHILPLCVFTCVRSSQLFFFLSIEHFGGGSLVLSDSLLGSKIRLKAAFMNSRQLSQLKLVTVLSFRQVFICFLFISHLFYACFCTVKAIYFH